MIVLDLSILNQKGTPMFNSDTFANRPTFGIVGRIFISTDTKEFFRDTGTSWELIGGPGSGTITGSGTVGTLPIWTTTSALGNSTLIEGATLISTTKDIKADAFYLTGAAAQNGALYWTSDRVTLANYNVGGSVHIEVNGGVGSTTFGTDLSLTNNGYISAVPTLTAANNASSVAIVGVNTLSYAAAFSANNIGAVYGGIAVYNLQTFAGSATFANSNVASGGASINSIDFSSGGSTITMTQSSGIRVMSGQQNLFQYQGTNSGTITHAAISQNTGFYRPSAATGILTITNAYSHLINALDDYGAGFTFTNRWGIYQAGASDLNYFASSVLIGNNVNSGFILDVSGTARILSNVYPNGAILTLRDSAATGSNTTFAGLFLGSSPGSDFVVGKQSTNTIGSFAIKTGGGTTLMTLSDAGAATITTSVTAASFNGTTNNIFSVSGSEKMRLDTSGILGLGVVPSAWSTSMNAIEVGAGTSLFSFTNNVGLSSNAYFTAFGWLYKNSSVPATKYETNAGQLGNHAWYTAPSGTAGNAISFTQAMTLFNTNNLSLGSTTDTGNRFYLNGSLRIDGQSSATSGGNSGQHLIINLDGTTYKIKLENP